MLVRIIQKLQKLWPERLRVHLRAWQRALVVVVVIAGLQWAVPGDVLPLRASIDGRPIDAVRRGKLEQQLQQDLQLRLVVGQDIVQVDGQKAGISVSVSETMAKMPALGPLQRSLPLGAIYHVFRSPHITAVRVVDSAAVTAYAEQLAAEHTYQPQDATLLLDQGKLELRQAKSGQTVTAADAEAALRSLAQSSDTSADVVVQETKPAVVAEDFNAAQDTYNKAKDKKLVVKYGDKTKEYPFEQVSTWLEVVKNDANVWRMQIKRSAFDEQSIEWGREFNAPAGVTQVTTVDDVEVSRIAGNAGRRINEDRSYALLNAWLANPTDATQELVGEVVAPRVAYTRTYTKSSAALQQKLNEWIASHSGSYQVALQELGGQGRTASYNVQKQTVMASTYKLFVAYAAYHQAENGALNLGTVVYNGKSIESCISTAIINSNNECAVAVGKYIGWANIDNIVHAAGFQNVFLNNYAPNGSLSGDKLVNANELARFLAQLSAGSLMNSTHTSTLLGYMKQQVYRSGIPAGSHGAVVADKVGFLDSYLHDAAIVYAPGSTYALVIMSSGSSWSNISNLADAVYSFMAE